MHLQEAFISADPCYRTIISYSETAAAIQAANSSFKEEHIRQTTTLRALMDSLPFVQPTKAQVTAMLLLSHEPWSIAPFDRFVPPDKHHAALKARELGIQLGLHLTWDALVAEDGEARLEPRLNDSWSDFEMVGKPCIALSVHRIDD